MLIIQPIGGLCNRMRAINSARVLAEKRHEKLVVIWFVNPELGCPFERIFEPTDDFKVINIHSKWNIKKLWYQITAILFGSFIGNEDIRSHRTDDGLDEDFVASSLGAYVYIATEEHFYPCHDYSVFLPEKQVQDKIDGKRKELGEHAVGVHIRRTDNMPSIGKSSTLSFIESMQKELEENPDTVFYLATDDFSEEEVLRERFPGKIVSYQERNLSRDSVEGIQDAMVDLYCLASTRKIIGSFFSSFTDIAADMQGIPKVIAGT